MEEQQEKTQGKKQDKKLWKIFWSTFYLSAFTFGGGYVIVSLMKKKFVDEYHWIEEEEISKHKIVFSHRLRKEKQKKILEQLLNLQDFYATKDLLVHL